MKEGPSSRGRTGDPLGTEIPGCTLGDLCPVPFVYSDSSEVGVRTLSRHPIGLVGSNDP